MRINEKGQFVSTYSIKERLLLNSIKTPDCWLWTNRPNPSGYGKIKVNRKTEMAHRIAYREFIGPIGDGLQIRHICHNRICINPAHLIVGTAKENAQDSIQNYGVNHRGDNHWTRRRDPNSPHILTESEVKVIRKLLIIGSSAGSIAKIFSVTKNNILAIKHLRTWRHVI